MDWAKWHDLYEVSTPLKERLMAVREQIAAAAAKVTGKSLHLVSICAGDGRDVIGTFTASDARQDVHATLIESHLELVTRGQAAVDQLGLARRITFRCADATQSSTYVNLRPAQIIVLSGVFGNLKERDVQRLIAALPSLCDRKASVIWTRNLFDDGEKATQIIRKCFVAADFTEEVLVRTPLGLFAVGTHAFRGVRRPLPVNTTLFEFTGIASIPSAVEPPHQQRPSPAALRAAASDALNREVTYADVPPRGLGTGAAKGGVAGAPDLASGDDGRVAPGGSV